MSTHWYKPPVSNCVVCGEGPQHPNHLLRCSARSGLAQHPCAHICRCAHPLDDHGDPHWHECGDCGREWHDDDYAPQT